MRPSRAAAATSVAALCLALALLPGTASAVTQQITASIAANTSWGLVGSGSTVEADVFWVRNSINVNGGVTLTVRQGVVIKFDSGVYLNVLGALQVQGTGAGNVIMTSSRDDAVGGDTNLDGSATQPQPSDWYTVFVGGISPDSTRFAFTQLRYAGYGNRGAVAFTNASGRLTNCTIQKCYYGVECSGTSAPLLVDTNIQTSTQTPVVMDLMASPVVNRLTFSSGDNGYDAYGLRGGTVTGFVTLPKRAATVGVTVLPNVTYVMLSSATINAGAGVTISPGVVLKLQGTSFTVDGNLTMAGTTTDTISVTSINDDNIGFPRDTNHNGSITAPARGNWSTITYNPGATGSMNYCQLRFGSNAPYYGMVDLNNVNLAISNTLLSDAAHGLAARGTAAPALNNVQIDNCSSTPTYQSMLSNPTYTGVTFLANAYTALGLIPEAVTSDAHLVQKTVAGFTNITYLVVGGTISMSSPAKLLIDPGVVLKFTTGSGLQIYGALDAQGTVPSPIIFTSYRDDGYGNPPDTNGDGSSVGSNNDWGGIYFDDTSNDALCKILNDRVQFGGSGYPYYAAITCLKASPTLTGNTLSNAYYGARFSGASSPVFTNNTVQNCTSGPLIMSVMADPTMTGNTFQNNGLNGIALESETITASATIKYRPTVTFPAPNQATIFAYVPTGTITVPAGMTLTVQPQVVLKPNSSYALFDVYGALNVVGGIGVNRVVVTSLRDDAFNGDTNADNSASSPGVGQWGSIWLEDTSNDAQCLLRNMLLQFGSNSANGVITTVSASPKLAALEFFQAGTALTCTGNSQPNCDSLTILNCTYLPIILSLASNPTFARMSLANNAWTALGLLGETVTQDVRTGPRVLGAGILNGMAYIPTGTITIASGAKWTITPGTIIKMGRVYSESFGYTIQIDGALVANGKPDSLIVFTSTADDGFAGDARGDGASTVPAIDNWGAITFGSASNAAATVVNNCRFRFGGFSGWAALRCLSTNTTVTNSTFYTCSVAVSAEGNAAPTFTNVSIDTCTVPIRLSLVSNPTFTNVNFVACTYTAFGVIAETIAQDLLWKIRPISGRLNMPYLVDGALGVGLGSTLTLQPGLIVKLYNGSIDVNKAFIAEGRTDPDSLIIFTSYRDDFYGGKTWTNPTNQPPAPNDWYYITIEGTAIDPQVRFRNCIMRYGYASTTQGVLRCVNSAPSIDSTLFAYNGCGISVEGSSNPTIHGCSLYGNTYFGVNNTGGSFCVNATGNYWGAASGPNDASALADICGTVSNAGSGDIVSQNVNYSGFVTTGVQNPLLGDVSLNGQVRAYDASLVLQSLVGLVLSPLAKLVANVDNSVAVDNLDASFILQFVAGLIPTLPGNQTILKHLPDPGAALAAAVVHRARGEFTLRLGEPRRVGEQWEVPILATGSAPIYGAEVELTGATAASLAGARAADGALEAHGTPNGVARFAMAAAEPVAAGEIATLLFPAADADAWIAPTLAWARVNSNVTTPSIPPPSEAPSAAYFAAPWPNPAAGAAQLRLGISSREAGARAQVRVFDLSGRLVRTVHDGALLAGVHPLSWDLRDGSGHPVAPGVYLVRAETSQFRSAHRLIVVR